MDKSVENAVNGDGAGNLVKNVINSDCIDEPVENNNDSDRSTLEEVVLPNLPAKSVYKTRLQDYYPLNDRDVFCLMQKSGRQFDTNFVNQLMLKLAQQNPENTFYRKNAVIGYMAECLKKEIRLEKDVNFDGYRLNPRNVVNPLEHPQVIVNKTVKQFLSAVKSTTGKSPGNILARKIANTIEENAAYELLISCDLAEPEGDKYQLRLLRDVTFSESVLDNLLVLVQNVYGRSIESIRVIPYLDMTKAVNTNMVLC